MDVIVSQDTIHQLSQREHKGMFIKLDLSKAYNNVRWELLTNILTKFGFNREWIAWSMECVTTASFSMHINEVPSQLLNKETQYPLICLTYLQKDWVDL